MSVVQGRYCTFYQLLEGSTECTFHLVSVLVGTSQHARGGCCTERVSSSSIPYFNLYTGIIQVEQQKPL